MAVPPRAKALINHIHHAIVRASWKLRADAWKPRTCDAAMRSAATTTLLPLPHWSCQCIHNCQSTTTLSVRPPNTFRIAADDYDLLAQFQDDRRYRTVR